MKKIWFSILLLSVSFLFAIDQVNWNYTNTKDDKIILEFQLNDFDLKTKDFQGESFQQIQFENFGKLTEIGLPELPTYTQIIAVSATGMVNTKILSDDFEIVSNVKIFPYQPEDGKDNSFIIENEFYSNGKIYPESIVTSAKPAIMRNQRLVAVSVSPFQFDPVKKQLIHHKKIDIEIGISEEKGENELTRIMPESRSFDTFFKSTVLNYEKERNNRNFQRPCYLFIYPTNSTIESTLEVLLDWKKHIGYEVHAVNTNETGTSLNNIKNYIQNAYDNWSNPPEFVCLIGDDGGSIDIPTGNMDGGEGDQYYTLLDGNDILADLFIGRLSVNSNFELQTIVSKILNYEKQPYMASTNWYEKALLVGDPTTSGYSCVITNKNIKEMMKLGAPNIEPTEVYSGSFVSQISNYLNSGVSFFNYRGWWGMSGWDTSDVANLNNGFMLPVVVTITCGTGSFSGTYDAVNESFLKEGSPSTPKGAVACIGTATASTHTTFNNCVDAGIFYGLFVDGITHMGGALNRGKFNLYHNFPDNPNNSVYKFSYWNNLMGDPGMSVWTDEPQEMVVEYDESIDFGTNYFEVEVKDAFGLAIEDAWVTILQGDDAIFATDYTDEFGKVLLPLPANGIGDVDITVTKQNYIPFLDEFEIESNDYSAHVVSFTIDDDSFGSSSGNNNNVINPGETIELEIDIENLGVNALTDVNASLTCQDEDVTVIDNFVEFGMIEPANTTSGNFIFQVSEGVIETKEIILAFSIEDDSGHSWLEHIILAIQGYHLEAADYFIEDQNNNIWDPGETVEFSLELFNDGSVDLTDVTVQLQCDDSGITLLDSIASFGNIEINESVENSSDLFQVSASPQVLPGTQVRFHFIASSSESFLQNFSYSIPVGTVYQSDPLGPDEYGYYCYDSGDTAYDLAPDYNWIEIDPSEGGNGTSISLNDNGDNGDIETIDVPFSFNFYGEPYDQITVCSNGFVGLGITEQYSYMNWHVPGPMGPSPMIAAFWDDLVTSNGNVCYKYDSSMNYFVIEWSELSNDYNTSQKETFQIIIFDPIHYPSLTGDADILIQYKEFNNINQGDYFSGHVQHGQYATVGIEDHTSTIGLEYTFNNEYPTAAKPLQDGMAILFTTNGGTVLDPPIAEVNVTEFQFALLENSTNQEILEISNSGEANLTYSITKNYIDNERSVDKDSGGPDNYGYQWFDSNELNGPTYSWREIAEIGTEVVFDDNDEGPVQFPLEFTFNFYGTDYNEFRINPNGWIGFGEDNDEWLNTAIPSVDAPNPAIFGYWDDLNPLEGGNIYYYSTPDSLVVEFDDVMHYSGAHNGSYTFEMIIYPSGKILLQYKSVTGDIDTSTVGIQDTNALDGLQIVYNGNYIHNEMAIEIKRVIEWVQLSSVTGIIPSGESDFIAVSVDSSDLPIGIYNCELILSTNDPNVSLLTIPIELQVLTSMNDIEVDVTELIWGEIEINETVIDTIVITNTGTDPLYISAIESSLDGCTSNFEATTLNQNENVEVIFTFTPVNSGEFNETITIYSNDPDESEYIIPITVVVLPGVSSDDDNLVLNTELQGNHPNPFNPDTNISFSLKENSKVELSIYNIKGEKVKTLVNSIMEKGNHLISWDGNNTNQNKVASGIYFYQLKTDNYNSIKKMILLK